MSASWAAVVISAIAICGSMGTLAWRDGRRDGKIDTALAQLAKIADDHENRLRSGGL